MVAHISPTRICRILKVITSHPAVLLRSPQGSGKTTLITELENYVKSSRSHGGDKTNFIKISMKQLRQRCIDPDPTDEEEISNEEIGDEAFLRAWTALTGYSSLRELQTCKKGTIICVDEVQEIYTGFSCFWDFLFSFIYLTRAKKSNDVHFLLLGRYGDKSIHQPLPPASSPLRGASEKAIGNALDMSDLCLSREELEVVVDEYCNNLVQNDLCIPDGIINDIYDMTGGHPGIVIGILNYLADINNPKMKNEVYFRSILANPVLPYHLKDIRALRWLDTRCSRFDDAERKTLRGMLKDDKAKRDISRRGYDERHIAKFANCGLIMETRTNAYKFSSPLIRDALLRSNFIGDTPHLKRCDNICECLLEALSRMSPTNLAKSYGRSATAPHNPLEIAFHVELYKALLTAKPGDMIVSCEVGYYIFRAKGHLDIYGESIGTNPPRHKWGFELFVYGNQAQEHVDRFDRNTGKYAPILDDKTEYIIVEFVPMDKTSIIRDARHWLVYYSEDFKHIIVKRFDGKEDEYDLNDPVDYD